MSANPLSAQPYRGATSKPELTPAAHCSSNPSCCVFPICAACSPVATVHHTAGEPADWRRYFRINFLLFVDFRATRHGHNCEPGPHSSDRTVSICSDQTDDLLSTNQNVFGQISVFAELKVFRD